MSRTYRRKNMSGYQSWCSDASHIEYWTTPNFNFAGRYRKTEPSALYTKEELEREMIKFHSDHASRIHGSVPHYTRNRYSRLSRRATARDIQLGIRYDDWDNRVVGSLSYSDDLVWWYW